MIDQLGEFNRVLDDLENVGVKMEDEDKAIHLLSALPDSYQNMWNASLYGRQTTLTLEEVLTALKTKEVQKRANGDRGKSTSAGLNVRLKQIKEKLHKAIQDDRGNSHTKQKDLGDKEVRKCHFCKKSGHLRRDCYAWIRRQQQTTQ